MRSYKNIGIGLILFFGLLFFLGVWYKYSFSMYKAVPMEINSPSLDQKILIATQGSEFKDKITLDITSYYKKQPVFIKVIDVTELTHVDPKGYDAIIVMHTWENWKPPLTVKNFIERTMAYKEKIVVLSTSGKGTYKIEGIDAISGESILEDTKEFSNKIIARVNTILTKD